MLTTKEAGNIVNVGAATIRNYITKGLKSKNIILTQEWSEDENGWEEEGWNEPEGYYIDIIIEYDKFYHPIKASFVSEENEKLEAISVMHGRMSEYRIKQSDLDYFRKKYLI